MRRLLALAPLVFVLTASSTALAAPPARVAQTAKPRGNKTSKAPKKRVDVPAPAPVVEEIPPTPTAPPPAAPVAAPAAATARPVDADSGEKAPSDVESTPISVAPLFGFATNHANLGIGVRGGYTLPQRIYIGGTFVYHFGTSTDIPSPGGGTFKSSVSMLYPGAEVGYAINAGPVVVRPYGGVGLLVAIASASGGPGGSDASDTSTSLAFWPGCTVSFDIPRTKVFVGADVRVLFATRGGDPSLGMFATAGMRF